jgi:polar amino acid transport system substrate-binding protein
MKLTTRSRFFHVVLNGLLVLAIGVDYARGMIGTELVVAISPDIPPYVMEEASRGLELEIVRGALPDHRLTFLQIPYEALQSAIVDGLADVAVGVQQADDGAYYSDDFITFANVAISKRADNLTIERIADLAGHRVLTWQNADLELGDEFEELFSPQSDERHNYIEVANQADQVRSFWEDAGDVAVIDRSIFEHFSREMGRSMEDVRLHELFPPVTNFKVGFRDAETRDEFDRGISQLCAEGEYAELLRRYEIHLKTTVCDGRGR